MYYAKPFSFHETLIFLSAEKTLSCAKEFAVSLIGLEEKHWKSSHYTEKYYTKVSLQNQPQSL
jgi:hypothetical protein